MKWKKIRVVERGKEWTDYVSADGVWRIAEGYDELARKEFGEPFTLMKARKTREGWRQLGSFGSVREAMAFTKERV